MGINKMDWSEELRNSEAVHFEERTSGTVLATLRNWPLFELFLSRSKFWAFGQAYTHFAL